MQTTRLALREPEESDAQTLLEYYTRNAERFAPWEPPRSADVASHRAWIGAARAARIDGHPAVFLAFDRTTAALVGVVDLHGFSAVDRSAMIAYTVDGAYEGRGYASEAVAAVLACAFGELGLMRISAYYDVANERSGKLLARNGFRVIATTSVVPGLERLMRPQHLAVRER
jgi:ribosomal-protein-alanine N-acetyltransferase